MGSRIVAVLVVVALGLGVFLAWRSHGERSEQVTEGPPPPTGAKLAVVLVFDQLRGEYLVKWQDLFGEGGFKRLMKEGAWFPNCHYPYATTLTAAGHASLLTGTTPHQHGIIANAWFDRRAGKVVESTQGKGGPGPERRLTPTLGDALLQRTGKRGKVVSLSIKERAAILMAAIHAQLCLWLSKLGTFETSRHYPELPPWVQAFNGAKKHEQYLNKPWTRLLPDLDYASRSGPDEVAFEGSGYNQGRTFPHPTPTVEAMELSPFGNDLLLELAKTAIEEEKLGQGPYPDLLCVSFSSNDLVGHCYGPDSQEVLDITLRSDRAVKELLDYLDAKVGKGNYLVGLSADHGVCPIPEVLAGEGKDAGRVSTKIIGLAAAHLQETLAKGKEKIEWFDAVVPPWVYFKDSALRAAGIDQALAEKTLADWVVQQHGVQTAFTRTSIATAKPLTDPLAEMVRQSFHPENSGDVYVVLKPHYLFGDPLKPNSKTSYATTHGSPHAYDTHVPLVVMGPGITAGTYEERVPPQIMTNLLAHGLGIEAPESARFTPPANALAKSAGP